MALLDEQLVDEWLNRQNFFTMRGIKQGVDEIDLLGIRHSPSGNDFWHVEVQISYRPIGYIGGDSNARKRSPTEIQEGVRAWVEKKFTSAKKVNRRNAIVQNANWHYVLVHGVVREPVELNFMKDLGVTLIPYKQVLFDLQKEAKSQSSSAASNIIDMLHYIQNE
ncbi:hypothetical protein [Limnohabitans sp.]|uniref:hypothetical protein n=1 Tax=Limnohabitans sp. TaxID=1907725 RepID=UPI00286FAC20|nr:hypothetical protein [Limnohabitans sp.]